jgi:hypothetical protein
MGVPAARENGFPRYSGAARGAQPDPLGDRIGGPQSTPPAHDMNQEVIFTTPVEHLWSCRHDSGLIHLDPGPTEEQ